MRRLVGLVVGLALTSCTADGDARRAVGALGMSDVEITGYAPFNCGEDDFSSTGFIAVNPQGERVEGVVCCGLIVKNCTVRW